MNKIQIFLAIALIAGCASLNASGNGTYDYSKGILTRNYDADVMKAYEASVKAMTDLAMTIRRSDKNESKATIIATRPDDMKAVVVNFYSQGPESTKASIRVGAEGDKDYSRVVAKRIEDRLRG